jgi:GntR family transcriptional regulator, trigonelline degradation regulator
MELRLAAGQCPGQKRNFRGGGLHDKEATLADSALRIVRNPAPIRTQVVDTLRQSILDRTFKPGQRLIERELVELTGVSRTSIREALRELSAEGLVTTIPNKGTVVTSVSPTVASELYQLRSALEGLAARLFIKNATDSQRRQLVRALQNLDKTVAKGEPILKAKDHFYDVLFEGAGNESLRAMAGSLHARVSVMRSLSLSLPGRPVESVAELKAVVDAIHANDAEAAARACSFHVEQAGRAGLVGLFSEQQHS